MIEWFYQFNHGEFQMLAKLDIKKGNFPVCKEVGKLKMFGKHFSALNLYYDVVSLRADERSMYEIVMANFFQKIYGDIDMPLDNPNDSFSVNDIITISKRLPTMIRDAIMSLEPSIQERDIMFFSNHYKTKRSFHYVVDRHCFANNKQNKSFFLKILEKIPEPYHRYFDKSMYKPGQQFRLYMCSKIGRGRFKKLDPEESTWEIDDDKDPDEDNLNIFLSSLITYTKDCKLLEGEEDEEDEDRVYNERDVTDVEIKKAIHFFRQMKGNGNFDIRDVQGSMINLNKRGPYICANCSELDGKPHIHHSENPMVYITYTGDVCFDCRRGGGRQYLGNVDEEVVIEEPQDKVKRKPLIIEDIKRKPKIIKDEEEVTPRSITKLSISRTSSEVEEVKQELNKYEKKALERRNERKRQEMTIAQRLELLEDIY